MLPADAAGRLVLTHCYIYSSRAGAQDNVVLPVRTDFPGPAHVPDVADGGVRSYGMGLP